MAADAKNNSGNQNAVKASGEREATACSHVNCLGHGQRRKPAALSCSRDGSGKGEKDTRPRIHGCDVDAAVDTTIVMVGVWHSAMTGLGRDTPQRWDRRGRLSGQREQRTKRSRK